MAENNGQILAFPGPGTRRSAIDPAVTVAQFSEAADAVEFAERKGFGYVVMVEEGEARFPYAVRRPR